jgi:hypothetical protein
MEYLFSNLDLVLQAKLASLTFNSEKILRMIAEDTGQLSDPQPALTYPACLVSLDDNKPKDIGDNSQEGTVYIRLTLVFNNPSISSSLTPLPSKKKALSAKEAEGRIHRALHGWSPSDEEVPVEDGEDQPEEWADVFGPLTAMGAKTSKLRDDFKIREMVFCLGYEDYSQATRWTTVHAVPDISEEFVDDLDEEL